MNKLLICGAIVLLLSSCNEDKSRKVILTKTPNGYPFHFMPIYEDGVTDITITIAWPMLWAYEDGRNPAVPYVAAESILSGGTDDLAPQDVLELFNDKNSSGQLYVRANHAIGELSFPKEHIEEVISIGSEMLSSPQFDQKWVNRIKQGLLANQTQAQTQAGHQMWAVARLAILDDGPLNTFLSLPNLGAIEEVSEDGLRRWHDETIVQTGGTIVVTGAISSPEAGKAIDRLLADLPLGRPLPNSVVQPDFAPRTILLHQPDAKKSTLGFIGQLPPTSEGGDLTDLLALQFFARTGDGPLFDAVRTELRASYAFQAGFTNYDRATRVIFIGGEVETEKLAQAANLVRERYEMYRSNPDLTGLDGLRQGIADATAQNVLFVDVAARTMLELALDGRDPGDAPRLGELLETIKAKDVQERLASVFPKGDSLIIVATSPDANAIPGACIITEIKQVRQCP